MHARNKLLQMRIGKIVTVNDMVAVAIVRLKNESAVTPSCASHAITQLWSARFVRLPGEHVLRVTANTATLYLCPFSTSP